MWTMQASGHVFQVTLLDTDSQDPNLKFCVNLCMSLVPTRHECRGNGGKSGPGNDGKEGVLYISQAPTLLEVHYQIILCHI